MIAQPCDQGCCRWTNSIARAQKTTAKAKVCQRHRFVVCQIRRKTISDIVGLRSNKASI